MADLKKILGNVALPEFSRLVYNLDSEGDGVKILNQNDHRIFSVRIDSETIKLNSEGNLYLPLDGQTVFYDESEGLIKATGLTVSEGEAIRIDEVVINGVPQETINVRYDSETIILDSENRLTVPIDRETIIINSEGQLVAIPEPLYDGVATHVHFGTTGWDSEAIDVLYDSETLRVDSENRLFVPIDKEMIIVNSEDLISLKIDNKTIIFENSEIQTRIGGWREDPVDTEFFSVNEADPEDVVVIEGLQAIPEIGDTVTIEYELESLGVPATGTVTFTMNDDGEWISGNDAAADIYIDGVRFKKNYTEAELILDPARAPAITNLVATAHGETYVYHKVRGIYLPTDNKTIYVTDDADQSLKVLYRVDEERGLEVDDSEERIFVKVDDETVIFDSEGQIALPIDRQTIFVDSETGLLKAAGLMVSEGDAIRIETSEVGGIDLATIHVRYDSETIVLTSEGDLSVPLDRRTIIVNSEAVLAVPIDEITIVVNSEGKLEVSLDDGEATEVIKDSEGKVHVNVRRDNLTIHLNDSENFLELWPDEDKAFSVNSEGKLFVKIDDRTIKYTSEGELVALPEPLYDGIATKVRFKTPDWDSESIDVLYDSKAGLAVDSENRLYVKLDKETAVFDSEGRVMVNIDHNTLVYNTSEGFIEVDRLTVPEVDTI